MNAAAPAIAPSWRSSCIGSSRVPGTFMRRCVQLPGGRVTLDGQRFDPEDPEAQALCDLFLPQLRSGASPGRSRRRRRHPPRLAARYRRNATGRSRREREAGLSDAGAGERRGLFVRRRAEDYPEEWTRDGAATAPSGCAATAAACRARADRRCGRDHGQLLGAGRGFCPANSASVRPAGISRRSGARESTRWRACRRRAAAPRRHCSCRARCAG